MVRKMLFSSEQNANTVSWLLLAARLVFGILLLSHGIQKFNSFDQMSSAFPDPLGVGSNISLILAIFAELICSIGFILGLLYRLAMLPMIFTMLVAFFVIHAKDPFAVKELAFIYLIVFILMYIAGPGKYSIDSFLFTKTDK